MNSKYKGAEIEALLDKVASTGMNYVELSEPTVPLAAVNTCYYMMALDLQSNFTIQAFETPTTPVAHYKFMFWGPSSLTLPPIYWLNGEIPELDPACLYELDIVATEVLAEGNYVYKAVLAKFNTVS